MARNRKTGKTHKSPKVASTSKKVTGNYRKGSGTDWQKSFSRYIQYVTPKWILPVLGVLFLLVFSQVYDPKLDLNGDNFKYINFSNSILEGYGYTDPTTPDRQPTNWNPPGYATLLAAAGLITNENIAVYKWLNGVFLFGSILILYFLYASVKPLHALWFLIIPLALFHGEILRWATIIMSEMPYMFVSYVSLYLFFKIGQFNKSWQNADSEKQPELESKKQSDLSSEKLPNISYEKYTTPLILLLSATSVTAYYFRSTGIVLIIAILLCFLLQKEWKKGLIYLLGVTILYAPWIIRNSLQGLEGRYLGMVMVTNPWRPESGTVSSFSEFFDKIIVNFYDTVIAGFPEVIFPYYGSLSISPLWAYLIGVTILIILAISIWNLKELRLIIGLYILGNIGVFLLWHGGNGARYVWPIAPLLAFNFYHGLFLLTGYIIRVSRFRWFVFLLLCAISLYHYQPRITFQKQRAESVYSSNYGNFIVIAEEIKKMNDPTLRVVSRKPEIFYYFSGAIGKNYLYSLEPDLLIRDLIAFETDYVVLEQLGFSSTPRYLYPAIQAYSSLFSVELQLRNPDTYLLKFDLEQAKNLLSE